jgi:hypothetical protein
VCTAVKRERVSKQRVSVKLNTQHALLYTFKLVCVCFYYSHNLPDSNAMLLPGRVPGYKNSDVKFYPPVPPSTPSGSSTSRYFKTFCTKVTGIKKLHHIRFDSAHPGFIFAKEKTASTEVKRSILKVASWSPQADQLPPVLHPAGLQQAAVVTV